MTCFSQKNQSQHKGMYNFRGVMSIMRFIGLYKRRWDKRDVTFNKIRKRAYTNRIGKIWEEIGRTSPITSISADKSKFNQQKSKDKGSPNLPKELF